MAPKLKSANYYYYTMEQAKTSKATTQKISPISTFLPNYNFLPTFLTIDLCNCANTHTHTHTHMTIFQSEKLRLKEAYCCINAVQRVI